ncbi:hypothetical protein J8281_17015 [Aquimarina sp. U1-2]|uniref:CdaR family protein n=1 Tax=Aquimarina sp. U1-2 TaxID=2823141 RepID=UPI001AECEA4D|nr:CdaR family protein [Aquimarina sp. U1-2]MBP2833900.1 hypothetical protein [Aquimarina sp. U1-2]
MSDRTKKNFSFKKSNVKTFLFFLVFTSILWLLIQFSKNYTQEVEVGITYVNIPEDRIFNEESDQTLRMTLNGNGFRLMNHHWKQPALEFNVDDAASSREDQYYFHVNKESSILKNKLDFKGRILELQKDSLRLKLDVSLEKMIPVTAREDIQYAAGYGSDKGLVVVPDSVKVSGPSKIIDTLNTIFTELLTLEDLNQDYVADISIEKTNLASNIEVSPGVVEANILVSKFTEGHQKIPITVSNVPEGVTIKIFPKDVSIVYRVGLDSYNEISERDFQVVADYAKVSEDSSFLTLELIARPKAVHDVRLQDKQIQFVVVK